MTTITREDYYKLVGLSTLVKQHNDALDDIKKAIVEVTGQELDQYGHCDFIDEAMWGAYSADELLNNLDIEVEA